WTLLMALVHLLPLPAEYFSLAVMLLGAAILIGNILVVYRIVQALDPAARFAPLIAAGTTAFYFPLVFWTLRGLEAGALALILSLSILLSLRLAAAPDPAGTAWLALSLAAALIIRMDAAIPVTLILIYLAGKAPRAAVLPAITSVLVLAGILLVQRWYFGDFLPNTYYLKVVGVPAWERIRAGLSALVDYASRDFLMPLFVALLGVLLYRGMRGPEAGLLLALFLGQAAYSVWVGGDYAEELVDSANRFIAQGMPALIILFSLVLERAIRRAPNLQLKAATALLIAAGAVIVMSGEPWYRWALVNAPMLRTDIQRTKLGLHIEEYTGAAAVIAVHAAGQIPYYSDRTTIDLLGKNDPVIAKGPPASAFAPGHNKWNYEYSIVQLQPDVVADNFNRLRDFMENQPGYLLLPNGIYVRRDSTLVDAEGLGQDYR
ncbi:MAG: hypothetical protein ACM3QS_17530, partial [Bacteroidota bacterium]